MNGFERRDHMTTMSTESPPCPNSATGTGDAGNRRTRPARRSAASASFVVNACVVFYCSVARPLSADGAFSSSSPATTRRRAPSTLRSPPLVLLSVSSSPRDRRIDERCVSRRGILLLHGASADEECSSPGPTEDAVPDNDEGGDGAAATTTTRTPRRKTSRGRPVTSYVLMSDLEELARRAHRDLRAGEKAERKLDRMTKLYGSGNVQCKPTAQAYAAVGHVWARRGRSDMALDVLRRLTELHKITGDPDLTPNTFAYNAVLDAYAQSREGDAAARAEALLGEMMDLHRDGNDNVRPNAVSFNTVLKAWSKSPAHDAAEKAEQVLQRMEELRRVGYSDVRPTTISFSSVITAWARSGRDAAADRADYILHRMMELSETNDEIRPNAFTLNAILDAWSSSPRPGAAEKCEQILASMEDMAGGGGGGKKGKRYPDVKPDTISYNTVLKAWSNSDVEGAARRAEDILNRMLDPSNDVRPNRRSFNTVIAAWAKSGEDGSVQRAEDVLLRMIELFAGGGGGHDELRPDVVTFTSVMNAWAKSREPRKAQKALDMLHRLEELHRSGNRLCEPNVISYNTVLNACAFSAGGVGESKTALLVAVTAFNELRKSRFASPDSVSYGMFIKACANLMPQGETRNTMVRKVWKICTEEGQVGSMVLSELRRAVSRDVYEELVMVPAATRYGGRGEVVSVEKLPAEWTRNAKGASKARRRKASIADSTRKKVSRNRAAKSTKQVGGDGNEDVARVTRRFTESM